MEPTASEDRYAPYIAGWKRRWRERARALEDRARLAHAAAERCARLLAEQRGARRVWLFGSTLTPERFHERSDIDLAAEGLDDWLHAGMDCEPVAPGFQVHIVPLEHATESMRRTVLEEGVLLYDAGA